MKFTEEQHKTWQLLFSRQLGNIEQFACREYLDGFKKLALPSDRIPTLFELNEKVNKASGWTIVETKIRYLTDRQWCDHMSKHQFPITNFIRDRAELDFTPEPDVFHDIFGHLPFLMNKEVATLMEVFSKAYVQNEKEGLHKVAQLWWFTIEFGLIMQGGVMKAFGAGLMSSFGEIQNVGKKNIPVTPFSIETAIATERAVVSFHPKLFVIDSVESLAKDLTGFFGK